MPSPWRFPVRTMTRPISAMVSSPLVAADETEVRVMSGDDGDHIAQIDPALQRLEVFLMRLLIGLRKPTCRRAGCVVEQAIERSVPSV